MPPRPPRPNPYRIQATDNALTVPGRTTFPKGTYISRPPTLSDRLPYSMSTGTQASGAVGIQGASAAMYPTQSQQQFMNLQANINQHQAAIVQQPPVRQPLVGGASANVQFGSLGITNQQQAQAWALQQTQRQNLQSFVNTPYPGLNLPTIPAATSPSLMNTLTGQMPAQPSQGAAPFGTNAYGERLDINGNVWNPETATADIYGGRFVQPGEKRWTRNKNGRLIQVQYGKNGKKREVGKGEAKQRRAEQAAAAQPVQQTVSKPSIANEFVSFRA
jgi:hypothetical protein